jgi:hypothetical protein
MTDPMAIKLAICLALFTGLLMVVIKLLEWRRHPETRPEFIRLALCRWLGHAKYYVALKTTDCVSPTDPRSNGKLFTCGHGHKIGEKNIYIARWACRRCPILNEECLENKQDWKIEHERLVPDVKKWANWSEPLPDPNEAARKKLKEIQERIAKLGPPLITVKTELVNAACGTCGWIHAGSCNLVRNCDRCKAEHTGSCPAL